MNCGRRIFTTSRGSRTQVLRTRALTSAVDSDVRVVAAPRRSPLHAHCALVQIAVHQRVAVHSALQVMNEFKVYTPTDIVHIYDVYMSYASSSGSR
jgi:hypothetical protein